MAINENRLKITSNVCFTGYVGTVCLSRYVKAIGAMTKWRDPEMDISRSKAWWWGELERETLERDMGLVYISGITERCVC